MRTIATQKWLTDFALPIVALAIVSLVAYAVWRQRWFRVRPVLSTYIWFLAITGSAALLVSYSLRICSSAIQYSLCQVYLVGYHATTILTFLLTVAVVYEFLFCMAGTDKKTRRTAVTGFAITMSLTIAGAYALMNASASSHNTLDDAERMLFGTTALALIASGIFIFAIKKTRSLFLETRLTIVLAALALYNFIDLLTGYAFRGSEQTRAVVSDVIWIAFTILLYWALRKGPAIPSAVTD
jgi:hypothetical protein